MKKNIYRVVCFGQSTRETPDGPISCETRIGARRFSSLEGADLFAKECRNAGYAAIIETNPIKEG